jgi:hypothetical protein
MLLVFTAYLHICLLWSELSYLQNLFVGLWSFIGDFNVIWVLMKKVVVDLRPASLVINY